MSKRQCPICSDVFNRKDDYIDHLRDEFDEHQSLADIASDEITGLGAEL